MSKLSDRVRPEPEETGGSLPVMPFSYKRLHFNNVKAPRLTHYLFRFPAKFHPPVAHSLIRSHTEAGQTVLDPFCGSGTLLLAAAVEGRNAIGSDVDPVAVFVSGVKAHRFRPSHLRASWDRLRPHVNRLARSTNEYTERQFDDMPQCEYDGVLVHEELWVPSIPNLHHWFRRYVVIDLARILEQIEQADIPGTHRAFFRLVFASIVRKSSNADPVPVSGLEVTGHMKRIDAEGRVINPFELFSNAVEKGLRAAESYWLASTPTTRVSTFQADATDVKSKLRKRIDAVITSPPYHNAVDYYRRHKLEMFWLGFTQTQDERLDLLPKYIGRPTVRKSDPILERQNELGHLSVQWYERFREVSAKRAEAFVHYMISMKDVFTQLAEVLPSGRPAVFVLGHSEWNGSRIPTSELFMEIAGDSFSLKSKKWYPVKNRYMSYGRRNGANIDQEFVLIFSRTNQ